MDPNCHPHYCLHPIRHSCWIHCVQLKQAKHCHYSDRFDLSKYKVVNLGTVQKTGDEVMDLGETNMRGLHNAENALAAALAARRRPQARRYGLCSLARYS